MGSLKGSIFEGKLEPEVKEIAAGEDHALTSIAISLKRIADALAGGADFTNAAYLAGQAFEAGRRTA